MTNIRNMYFIAIVAVALMAPAMSWHLETEAPRTYLEGRVRPKIPALTWKAVGQGKWQSAFDAALAFSVPNRDEALLADARWQRKIIGVAAWMFGFDAYPTFYGSRFVYICKMNRITMIPVKSTSMWQKKVKNSIQYYISFLNRHKKYRFFFAFIDRPNISVDGYLYNYVKNTIDYHDINMYLSSRISKNGKIIDLGYNKGDNIYRYFYRTDHHWNINGAIRAYNLIAESIGFEPILFGESTQVTKNIFLGSLSR